MRFFSPFALIALLACSTASHAVATDAAASANSGSYSVEVTDAYGSPIRTFERYGRTYVLGDEGQRYRIRVRNHSGERIEAVISVDGRDVLDGQNAATSKAGYLVAAHGEVAIDGFRLSNRDVATFRFSPVADSYAAQMGNDRNVGVIGVAIFRERRVVYRPQPTRRPNYPDNYGNYDEEYGRRESKSEKQAPAGAPADSAAPRSEGAKAGAVTRDAPPRERAQVDRPGLGTAFGERRESRVVQVDFARNSPNHPDAILALNYNDRPGLIALGIDLRPPRQYPRYDEPWRRETAQPFFDRPRPHVTPPPIYAAPPPNWQGGW